MLLSPLLWTVSGSKNSAKQVIKEDWIQNDSHLLILFLKTNSPDSYFLWSILLLLRPFLSESSNLFPSDSLDLPISQKQLN